VKYPGIVQAFTKVLKDDGVEGFVQGWAPTFVGYFAWGGVSYALTEFIRRSLTEIIGVNAGSYEVPIILTASAFGALVGSFILCPFESVRIRTVSQKDYAPDILQVVVKMINDEGVVSLFAAIPGFLAKEIPFAMAKFTVFDLSTAWLYYQFPAAREDLQLSLLVTLLGGTIGGLCAAVVSNPADVTITTMKRAKSELGALAVAKMIVVNDGVPALFRGLPLRLIFVALNVSFQFLIYDTVRFALGIGSDDLKLYLDVLGGALSGTGGAA
jgi:solute carrier family 25 (mitochondrial phosphate transporter), member 3